jgi:hypothetical protein
LSAPATDEYLQDLIGAMVSGNTETGIAVTYDDTNGKMNFDAQTAGDLRYAPIAKGVTNGDSHDHEGGDGGALAYLIPFATYVDLNPMTATGKIPYAATIYQSATFIRFDVAVFTVGAAHGVANYYTLTVKLRQTTGDVTVCSVNTQTLGSGIAGHKVLSTTSFTTGSVTGTGYLYLEVTKTGAPSDIYIVSPIFKAR